MLTGVSKSGSPCDRVMMSRPEAANSVASAVMAIVGEGLTRARRSARKAMVSLSRELPTEFKARGRRCEDGPRDGEWRRGPEERASRHVDRAQYLLYPLLS